jgi:Tol biopolymer transport system component
MKIINLKLVVLLLTATAGVMQAQEIKEGRTRQIARHAETGYNISAISPDGRKLLLTAPDYKGIFLMDKRRGVIEKINEMTGAGFEPCFSPDGRYIVFKTDDYRGVRKLSSLMRYELATGETTTLVNEKRSLTTPGVSGNRLYYLAEGKLELSSVENISLKGSVSDTVLLLEDLTPVLCINGENKTLKPSGEGSYIWISLSPDKTRVVYYFAGKGTFICDLEGKILFSAGKISAPKWLNNQIIIGMDDSDDGYRVTGSELVSFSLSSGKAYRLTSTPSVAEMYPLPFPDGKNIAFQTVEGKLFLMKLRFKK